ncbi:PWWP domain-containing protein 2A [Channa argus]|uniref:PWWP domain-containing protein 2A n=1 Tax=Channa argus TaxID=215402 RepID=UPI00294457B7|nr:hypothetical protein Q8A73_022866 [Channa argus]
MAAVAADAGAAVVPTTTTTAAADDESPPESGPPGSELQAGTLEHDGTGESGPVVDLVALQLEDGGDGEERRHVRSELEPAAGTALCETAVTDELIVNFPVDRGSTDRFSPGLPGDPEGGGNVYCSILPDQQPSAVFLHSFPAPPPATEAGLSLAEPAEPTTNVTTDRAETGGQDMSYTALVKPELRPEPPGEAMLDSKADRLSVPVSMDSLDRHDQETDELTGRSQRDSSSPCRSPKRRLVTDKPTAEESFRPDAVPEPLFGPPPVSSVQDLSPGSEVRVSLDHVIDDALVVSFRVGEKVFSGVLMDVSRRFGPYGIPITVFPRRDDLTPQMSLQPQTTSNLSTKREENPMGSPAPAQTWTSKPPPLFHEGAPYPPPLFIRDTYNQTLPQPPPRKIKRLKRRYRCEEPTSIMNAIKLRPRQVLCDKCKGVVTSGGHREARRGPLDLRGEDASRRRRPPEGPMSLELKRLRNDDKGARAERRSSSGIRATSSPSSSRLRTVAPSSSSSSSSSSRLHLKLNSKKVLAKGSADRSKARQVLKNLTRSSQPPRSKDQNQRQSENQDCSKTMTRAAALQNHNQKVHFTRRLQHLSGTASPQTALPPRMRLKPQRYRTDEAPCPPNKHSPRSSPPKPPPSPSPTHDLGLTTEVQPPSPPSLFAVSVSMQKQEVCPPDEEHLEPQAGGGEEQVVEPPPPSSSVLDSSTPSECSSIETFDLPPSGDLTSSLPPPAPLATPSFRAEEEEEEEGSDLKRRRKSSSSPSSSVFSKSVSKVLLPDGRTVCVGDIVWAKIYGFPWWPARVLAITVSRRGDTGLAVQQEARVSWFGSPTTSFLPLAQLSPFLETFQSRFDRKRKGPYRRAIAEAASAAKQLTPEVRALLTQFET